MSQSSSEVQQDVEVNYMHEFFRCGERHIRAAHYHVSVQLQTLTDGFLPCSAGNTGVPERRRQRQVIQEAHNGGEPCPSLYQTAGCAEYHDQHGPCLQSLVPALITTGGYGNARKKREILDNNITGYCVEFKLTSLTAGCQRSFSPHTHWMRYLKEGHQVCVECQPPALAQGQRYCSGDGENMGLDRSLSLQWQAVGNSRCRGLWRRVRRRDSCSCPTVHSFLFI
ncbi:hypothetical protein G5714_007282 [Onychostoma macrolepis]|uniref:SBSPON-like C-terminal domain-containing protein n=1 Tax=Onychostoma macrolepis TaxID=369639 RepID=A0A7J6CZV6_9TELE|nr:hypothetical protein G5714_007282 [Onychostoma macrolepis]